jgi:hypothetical protein
MAGLQLSNVSAPQGCRLFEENGAEYVMLRDLRSIYVKVYIGDLLDVPKSRSPKGWSERRSQTRQQPRWGKVRSTCGETQGGPFVESAHGVGMGRPERYIVQSRIA